MYSVPILIKHSEIRHEFEDGFFISLPVELRDRAAIEDYLGISDEGWSLNRHGYSSFSLRLPSGALMTAPGIYILNHSKPRVRYHGYKPTLSTSELERIVRRYATVAEKQIEEQNGKIGLLVHDLRALSSSLYNSAQEGINLLDLENAGEARVRFLNIIASQGILRMRIDSLEYLNVGGFNEKEDHEIQFFRKIDKVVRTFKPTASKEAKKLTLDGTSFGSIVGPNIFELAPYVLIDNAIKYSPPGTDTKVYVAYGAQARLTVVSYGPKIRPTEFKSIFERGSRGFAAISSGRPGSGLGLYMLRSIVEDLFYGSIEVSQDPESIIYEGDKYYPTTFQIDIPSHA